MRISVGGDAEGGWLIDVHDGVNHAVYSPSAKNAEEAEKLALDAHKEAFPPAEAEAEEIIPAADDAAPADSTPVTETAPTQTE